MRTFSASGGHEKSRRSKELSIDERGVGWLDLLLRCARCLRVLQYVLLFAGIPLACAATSGAVTLAWDDSDPNVAGYRLYYGIASRTYPVAIDVGPATSCSVSNLISGTTYFFAVTAYSHFGIESDFSSEIAYTSGDFASDSSLRIASIFADDRGTVLSWASEPGALYRVLATQTLTDPVWVDVSGPLFAASTTRLWTHIRPTSGRCLFYRVELISGVR
jgi:hypothetical protein